MGKKIAHAGSLFKRKSELRKIGVSGHMVPGHTLSRGGRVLISALLSSALKGNHLQRTFRQFYPPSTVPEQMATITMRSLAEKQTQSLHSLLTGTENKGHLLWLPSCPHASSLKAL